MIYDQLKKHKFDFDFKPDTDTPITLVNEPNFWILKSVKKFQHKHYREIFDGIFYGLFFKFVSTLDDGHDYRINLHCDGAKCRYLVTYIAYEMLVKYDFRTPDKITILGTECSFETPNDVLFNFELQYPCMIKDVNSIIQEIQKKHP